MMKYVLKRIVIGMISLFMLLTITFFLTRAIPGSPFESSNVSGDVLLMLEEEYGLNEPVLVQYGTYLLKFLHGDLGYSYKDPSRSVLSIIETAMIPTIQVGLFALLLSLIVGVLSGVFMKASKRKTTKGILFVVSILGTSIPNFVVALILLLVFGVVLKWFPVAGLSSFRHFILPAISLAVYPTSVIGRMVCNLYERECEKDYVILAKAKGLSSSRIVWYHMLRHIFISLLHYLGPVCTFLLTGSFVVESIFSIPGLGMQFVSSISNRDYTLIMGLTIFMGTVVILIQLMVDLLCGILDPRIRRFYDVEE